MRPEDVPHLPGYSTFAEAGEILKVSKAGVHHLVWVEDAFPAGTVFKVGPRTISNRTGNVFLIVTDAVNALAAARRAAQRKAAQEASRKAFAEKTRKTTRRKSEKQPR